MDFYSVKSPRESLKWAFALIVGALISFVSGYAIACPGFKTDKTECGTLLSAREYSDALRVCKKTAQEGEPASQFNLSVMYTKGFGVKKDPVQAMKWLNASASKRYPPAEYALSSRYASGIGVKKDVGKAVGLLTDAANQGFVLAQYMLGRMNEVGYKPLGIEKNVVSAIKLYRCMAEQCPACQYELFRVYYFGIGVDKDIVRAVGYLTVSAKAGLPKSQMQLGFRYYDGEGVGKDYVQAYKWFYIAAKAGEETSRKVIRLLSNKMSFSQIREAKAQAEHLINSQIINTNQLCAIYNQFCGR